MEIKVSILVVDDDSLSRNLLCKLIEKIGYHAVPAESGEQACALLKSKMYDLIIADYEMPGMNGLELLREARANFPRTPYILVTAYSNFKVISEAWANGAFDFFQKPVFVDRFNQTVRLAVEYGHLSIARRKFPHTEELKPDPDLLNIGVVRELAIALNREDLLNLVEEFETHARIELQQVIRFNMVQDETLVRDIAHRLAGTAINLGLVQMAEELRNIENQPKHKIENSAALETLLEKSIHWLKHYLAQIFQDVAS